MKSIHWFRRDLRLEDNAALYHALKNSNSVQCIFIFDTEILSQLEDKDDARVTFIHREITRLGHELKKYGSSLKIYYGKPITIWKDLIDSEKIESVYINKDYEPYAIRRDFEVEKLLKEQNIQLHQYKDHVLFEENEIIKDDGKPYTIFTPYSRKWLAAFSDSGTKSYSSEKQLTKLVKSSAEILSLKEIGFKESTVAFPAETPDEEVIRHYNKQRDYPGIDGTSRIGVHLRFGTVSIRKMAVLAKKFSDTWLNELIWREFYQAILYHFPYVTKGAFKPQYNRIRWRNNEKEFHAWCNGITGYPIVDAGMRELNATGFMHNRVRMITASFLCKHLLIDWRWGEAYFARKLLDYELASNNGGWQWAAGTGCDAAPYFRIFNPYEQTKKFDQDFIYIRTWVPEFEDFSYPPPIVDHKAARERCLKAYNVVKEPG
jgi:deoxyribodipyrimidine photo-lyase